MARYEVSVNNPTAGDVDLEVLGVGLVHNGGSAQFNLTDELAQALEDDASGIYSVTKVAEEPEVVVEQAEEGGE